MNTIKHLKICCISIATFLVAIIMMPSLSHAENNQQIPAAFIHGTWISMPSTKEEKELCEGKPIDSDIMRIYSFNTKTNSFKINTYEDQHKAQILSFNKITPTTIRGKARYIITGPGEIDTEVKDFEFTIKNNRLYSSTEFSEEYDVRPRKFGLYHCI